MGDETTKEALPGSADFAEAVEEIKSYQVDADQVKTLDACDRHIAFLKEELVRRTRLLDRTEQAKKDVMAGWKDTIKYQKQQNKDTLERLSAMEDRKRFLAAGGGE